jgi:hypothetical protein
MVTHAVDPLTKRLQCLLRHIENVRDDCELLGTRLIERGEFDFGKTLIQHGLIHDNSKFEGIEWEELNGHHDHLLEVAIREHNRRNPHHPEYWGSTGGIHEMPRIFVAEMCCDWHSRSAEFGSALRPWIEEKATSRFGFTKADEVYKQIDEFLNLLLEPAFP